MTTTYAAAPDVAKIAKKLIGKHHTRLADVRIECVYRDKAATSNGKTVLGKARKMSGLNAFMAREITSDVDADAADPFFVIEIAEDEWRRMGPAAREALVDHELCHCTAEFDEESGEYKLGIRAHDVEAFAEEVTRHGLWHDELKTFGEAVKEQLGLFDDDKGNG